MKSITKMPGSLIQETVTDFCNKLWDLAEEPKCRDLGAAISEFEETLRNFIINELFASSIVEEK